MEAPLLLNGIEVHFEQRGQGPALALLHETASSVRIWDPLVAALGEDVRTIALDRRGWGGTGAPQGYAGTTVEEQSEDAAVLLDALGVEQATLCGAGLGAVAVLDLVLRHPRLAAAAVLIEPPLLALAPGATEAIAADRTAIAEAVREAGPQGALDRYLDGALPALGAGAERLPEAARGPARERARSLFAELAAVPAWPIPARELAAVGAPSLIVVSSSTPPLLRLAGEALAARLGGSRLVRLGGAGLPHVDAATELASEIRALLAG